MHEPPHDWCLNKQSVVPWLAHGCANPAGAENLSLQSAEAVYDWCACFFYQCEPIFHVLSMMGEAQALYGLWCTVQGYGWSWEVSV